MQILKEKKYLKWLIDLAKYNKVMIYIFMKSLYVKYWLPSFCRSKAASYSWGDVLNKFQHKKVSAYSDEIEGTK